MHELSIVMSIIDIAQQQTDAADSTLVDEIELEIGSLSGVDMDALEFAWDQAVKDTILENAVRKINLIEGKAVCLDCKTAFNIQNYYEPCPGCNGHLVEIVQGKELRVKSLIVS